MTLTLSHDCPQVVLTVVGVAAVAMSIAGLSGPSAIILGGALAMSSTAVGIQVLEERHEMGSRHGRAIFSVLLLQDLAVVVLLMLIPLLAPSPDGSSVGGAQIAKALGTAAIKAVVCIGAIFAGGRLIIAPLYKWMSRFNAEIFSSTTLVVVLGTSFLTSLAGLSLALGAFLAGLLISETEYALQVESDIAPYKGLLMGLFFMSVGMEISGQLFLAKWKEVLAGMALLIGGKLAVMAAIGPMFGLSRLASVRSGLLIAPGGEFAFVAFGEAVSRGVLPVPVTNLLYLVVALSMAMIPYLATFGGTLGSMMEKGDTKALQPKEEDTKELRDHVIICGFGRSGQLIAELLSENQIPFVAVDQNIECVSKGKAKDLPVYFGDAGSPAVLHLLGADRAACAIIALDSPGACYRAVYTMQKHHPSVKTFARARDVKQGLVLEKAGATAVVPETLEPSLQLCSSILVTAFEYAPDEASRVIDDFRKSHLEQLTELAKASGLSAGYGH
jgi:Kef-type K+ transport system membrane component KefB/voltage-gated potassium channel Kch